MDITWHKQHDQATQIYFDNSWTKQIFRPWRRRRDLLWRADPSSELMVGLVQAWRWPCIHPRFHPPRKLQLLFHLWPSRFRTWVEMIPGCCLQIGWFHRRYRRRIAMTDWRRENRSMGGSHTHQLICPLPVPWWPIKKKKVSDIYRGELNDGKYFRSLPADNYWIFDHSLFFKNILYFSIFKWWSARVRIYVFSLNDILGSSHLLIFSFVK